MGCCSPEWVWVGAVGEVGCRQKLDWDRVVDLEVMVVDWQGWMTLNCLAIVGKIVH